MAITHAITKFDPIVAVIRSHLLSDDRFLAWDKWQGGNPEVYPRYITFAENADFPCITICRDYGMTDQNRTGYQRMFYYVHGWLKSPEGESAYSEVDNAAYLMQLVTDILDTDCIRGNQIKEFAMCRLMDSICPAFNKESRTTYFMTRWRIVASKKLTYESILEQTENQALFWRGANEAFWKGL